MGPISRVNSSQADPYLLWRERLEERNAQKAKGKETEGKAAVSQGMKETGDEKGTKSVPKQRTRDEYVPGTGRTPESDKLPENGKEPDKSSKKADGKKPETYRASTDKVDREIEKLKKRKEELEGQIRTETDERKIQSLERELAQVERKLSQKDNDGYRRQHTVMTKL